MLKALSSVLLLGLFAFAQDSTTMATMPNSTPSKATVYVYRYKQFTGSALAPSVYCDEIQLARMENGRYFTVSTEPGKHVFHSNDKQSGIELDLKAGDEYFIRVEIVAGFAKGHGRLILVAPEQGRYELSSSKLRPLDADKVADKTRVSIEEVHTQAKSATSGAAVRDTALTSTESNK
jgi:Protein of unknown function (DUF2846)